jgi:23S rRNA (cytosine1962-C5)-methyltransferase
MLSEAAARAGRTVQIIETFSHGIDHPVLASFVEGEYLKCLVARVS